MTKKELRLDYIRRIINQHDIRSQEQLLEKLSQMGYNSTQATLSRDLQQLRAIRSTDRLGHPRYLLPTNPAYVRVSGRRNRTSATVDNSLLSVAEGGVLIVLRTIPGFAAALAGTIDNAHLTSVAGPIAGDDTILVVGKDGFEKAALISDLSEIVPAVNAGGE